MSMGHMGWLAAGFVGLCALPVAGNAHEAGDFIFRAGVAYVNPNDDSGSIKSNGTDVGLGSSPVKVDSATSLGLTFAYMFTDNIAVEVLGAWPFKHDLKGNDGLDGVSIGSIKQLPPTVTAQYHFRPKADFQPYVGVGVNYTYFFDEDADGELEGLVGKTDLSLDNSWGLAGQVGADYALKDGWMLNAALWYIDINTTAKLKTAGAGNLKVDVDVDPWVFMVGVGKSF